MKNLFLLILAAIVICVSAPANADTISVILIPVRTTDVAADMYMFDPFDGHYLGVFYTDSVNANIRQVAISGPDGNIYISDYSNSAVYVHDRAGNYLYTYADASDGLTFVRGIAFRGGHLFIPNNTHVAEFDGPHSRLPDFIPDVDNPHEIFFLEDGRCLVSVAGPKTVRLYNADGTPSADLFITSGQPQQIQADPQLPGAYLNASFYPTPIGMITDFDLDGTIHNMIPGIVWGGGVYRLGNGNLLITNFNLIPGNSDCGVYEITNAGDTVEVEFSGAQCYWPELCEVEIGGPDCVYIPGDCDHNGTALELGDVIAMIGMYRGTVEPYYICDCGVDPPGAEFAATADPNGNCVALELGDVVIEIGAYRGTAEASGCIDCPGSLRLLPGGEEMPLAKQRLKAKSKTKAGSSTH